MTTPDFSDLDDTALGAPSFLEASARFAQQRAPLYRSRESYRTAPRSASTVTPKADWCRAHVDVLTWVSENAGRNGFASSLRDSFARYGSLTVNQVAAVRKSLASVQAAAVATVTANAGPKVTPNALDLSTVPEGRYAVPDGDTRLKVLIQRPEPPSKWAGWIFVSDAAEYGQRKKYGAQRPGQRYSGQVQEALRAIAADPRAASIAYGKLTGTCGVCGRHLEDADSVARGIGPICAAKFGA